jgi:hypothetical protein
MGPSLSSASKSALLNGGMSSRDMAASATAVGGVLLMCRAKSRTVTGERSHRKRMERLSSNLPAKRAAMNGWEAF